MGDVNENNSTTTRNGGWEEEVENLVDEYLLPGDYLVLVFDLDDTCWDATQTPFPQVETVLKTLFTRFRNKIRLCVASYNLAAPQFLHKTKLAQYFDLINYGRTYTRTEGGGLAIVPDGKVGMLGALAILLKRHQFDMSDQTTAFSPCPHLSSNFQDAMETGTCKKNVSIDNILQNMILFDDQNVNHAALTCSDALVQLVDCRQGVQAQDVVAGIKKWADVRRKGQTL